MTLLESYRIYLALRLHFTKENYNICKTKGRVRASLDSLEKKPKIKYQLQKFCRKYPIEEDYINFLVANFIEGDKWGGMYNNDAHDIYVKWLKTHDSLSYTYSQDIQNLSFEVSDLNDLWNCAEGHPIILKRYLGKHINLETLVILNKLYKFTETLDEQLFLDPIWGSVSTIVFKYSPFIKIDKDKFSMMTQKVFG
jgi:hypothetical protein